MVGPGRLRSDQDMFLFHGLLDGGINRIRFPPHTSSVIVEDDDLWQLMARTS